jgi:hypothetical protein
MLHIHSEVGVFTQDLLLPSALMLLAVVTIRVAYATYARYFALELAREAARLERLPGRRR